MQLALTKEEIRARVYGAKVERSFTKEEMHLYGREIRELRKERSRILQEKTLTEVTSVISGAMEQGFYLADFGESSLKTKDKFTLTLERKKGETSIKDKAKQLETENEQLKNQMAEMAKMLADLKAAIDAK